MDQLLPRVFGDPWLRWLVRTDDSRVILGGMTQRACPAETERTRKVVIRGLTIGVTPERHWLSWRERRSQRCRQGLAIRLLVPRRAAMRYQQFAERLDAEGAQVSRASLPRLTKPTLSRCVRSLLLRPYETQIQIGYRCIWRTGTKRLSTSLGSSRMILGPDRYAARSPAAIRRRNVRVLTPVRSAACVRDSNCRRAVLCVGWVRSTST